MTALDEYPRGSAMSEPELIHAYGGLGPRPSADPTVSPDSGSRAGDLQSDQQSADDEPVLCMEPECAHPQAAHADETGWGCFDCPCPFFEPTGPPDEYDRWRDEQLEDRPIA